MRWTWTLSPDHQQALADRKTVELSSHGIVVRLGRNLGGYIDVVQVEVDQKIVQHVALMAELEPNVRTRG